MIDRIELDSLIPGVFSDSDMAGRKGIWLNSTVFTRGNLYMVSAESGTGKSSLCSFLYGNRTDYRGRILFDGRDTRQLTVGDWCALRRDTISWMPQELELFDELSAIENIRLKNALTGFRSGKWIADALERLEVTECADRPAGRISVGQRQRIALIRALCQPFGFLLLDEPVSHLDPRRSLAAAGLIAEAAAEQGASVIATSVGNDLPLDDVIRLRL